MKRKQYKKTVTLLVSVVLLLTLTVGGMLAYLFTSSNQVVNTFELAQVTTDIDETVDGTEKKNVSVKNTGTTDAYIRAAVIVTFKNAAGELSPVKPMEGTHYEVSMGTNWSEHGTYWYHKGAVAPNDYTSYLIERIAPIADTAPEGYFLNVEIAAQGIQSTPDAAVKEIWGEDALEWVKEVE